MAKIIYVKASEQAKKQGRVIIWERDPSHPGGEIFISGASGDKVFEVGDTGAVRKEINAGLLEETKKPSKETPEK